MKLLKKTPLDIDSSDYVEQKKYFYKVSNHHELYRIGEQFYEDYLQGVRSFAISSTGYYQSQQNSILGLASFFEQKENGLNVAIISKNLNVGLFKKLTNISRFNQFELSENVELGVYNFNNHFDFFDLEEYLDTFNNFDNDFSQAHSYQKIKKYYDVILWDVPNLDTVRNNAERYHNMIVKFESLSIIVAKSLSTKRDVEDVKYFFKSYGISLKGLLINKTGTKNKSRFNFRMINRIMGRSA